MRFTETGIPGAFVVDIEKLVDERGFFARTWCSQEFHEHGLPAEIKQTSIAFNKRKGTLRGMHFSTPPCREGKLIRCIAGSILDVIVDIRPDSPAFLQHIKVELSADTRNGLYVPPGVAHGYQTLQANTEVLYMMTEAYSPDHAAGFRWNDPAFGIDWPEGKRVILDRDNSYPDFDETKVRALTISTL